MADLKVADLIESCSHESMMVPVLESMLNAKAVFSVKHLLDMHDQTNATQQDQKLDDVEVLRPHEASVTRHDLLMHGGTSAGVRLVGSEMSPSVPGHPSRHGSYSDMPDLVQTSAIIAAGYDQDHPYTRWLQSAASLDCFSGLQLHFHRKSACIKLTYLDCKNEIRRLPGLPRTPLPSRLHSRLGTGEGALTPSPDFSPSEFAPVLENKSRRPCQSVQLTISYSRVSSELLYGCLCIFSRTLQLHCKIRLLS